MLPIKIVLEPVAVELASMFRVPFVVYVYGYKTLPRMFKLNVLKQNSV